MGNPRKLIDLESENLGLDPSKANNLLNWPVIFYKVGGFFNYMTYR